MANEVRAPWSTCSRVLAGYEPTGRRRNLHPFADIVPGFFDYLVQERGLRPFTVRGDRIHLDHFETYLRQIGVESIRENSPMILSAFLVERAGVGLAKTTVRDEAGSLKVSCVIPTARASSPET